MIAKQAANNIKNSSAIRLMFEEGQRLAQEYGAENVFDFSLGNPDLEPPKEILESIKEEALRDEAGLHGYMPNAGFPALRAEVADLEAKRNGVNVESSGVVITVGAAGALSIILHSLLDPGDEVIIIAPYFTEYTRYISLAGGQHVTVKPQEDLQLDLDAIEKALTPKTKAIIINSPNNPSGAVYTADSLAKLNELLLAQDKTIYVISDEPYREINYLAQPTPPVLKYLKNAIIAYSWSKSYSLPGERIGYACCSCQIADYERLCQALIFYNRSLGFVNAPAFMQRVLLGHLDLTMDISPYLKRRDLLLAILEECALECPRPDGAFYLFPKVPESLSEQEFIEHCKSEHILVVGGSGFGLPGYVRLCYAINEEQIKRSREAFLRVKAKL